MLIVIISFLTRNDTVCHGRRLGAEFGEDGKNFAHLFDLF